jgi:hypothetical protein
MPKDLQKEKFRQQRVVIENINPQIQCGSYYIKRVVGEEVTVWADILPDGHDIIQAEVLYRHENEKNFRAVRMTALGNDVFNATFLLDNQGFYEYKIQAWVDHALNWQHGLHAKLEDGQQVRSELLDGIQYLEFLKGELPARENDKLAGWISVFGTEKDYEAAVESAQEVRDVIKAMRLVSAGGTRPDTGLEHAAAYWGLSVEQYKQKADIWPINKNGELLVSVIIESREGVAKAREIAAEPGVGQIFAGYGTLGSVFRGDPEGREAASAQILAACKEFKVPCGFPVNNPAEMEQRMKEGWSVFIMQRRNDDGFGAVEMGRKLGGR